MGDNTTLHSGWMPGSPSMNQGGALAPDFEHSAGEGASGVNLASQTPPSPGMDDSGDIAGAHIMESDFDAEFPGSGQGNLEKTSNGSAKGS